MYNVIWHKGTKVPTYELYILKNEYQMERS